MNTITTNPSAAMTMAQQMIDERVHAAQQRAQVKALRAQQRSARRTRRLTAAPPRYQFDLPWWAFRFARPVH
jgi:hypothetical protein